jgi:hypothetical protein
MTEFNGGHAGTDKNSFWEKHIVLHRDVTLVVSAAPLPGLRQWEAKLSLQESAKFNRTSCRLSSNDAVDNSLTTQTFQLRSPEISLQTADITQLITTTSPAFLGLLMDATAAVNMLSLL